MRRPLLYLSFLCVPLAALLFLLPGANSVSASDRGPSRTSAPAPKGHLLIVGGGGTTDDMYARALALGGGAQAKVVVFPQASELPDTGESSADAWRECGAGETRVADTRDEAAALELIANATIIWFPGGVQTRLMSALGPNLPQAIRQRYQDGAVIGGTSAGAAVMSNVMLTGEVDGASGEDGGLTFVRGRTVETGSGLGLVDWAIVDQHFLKRRRFQRLLSAVLDHQSLVGIGIDERTAILVQGKSFEVLGESNVFVIDARKARELGGKQGAPNTARDMKLELLRHGMRYDLAE